MQLSDTISSRDAAPADSVSARLLVVDDDENNRDMLSRRLQRRGFEVVVAEDGQKALDAMAGDRFDLVLLDVMMPGITGLEVLTTIRKTYPPTTLPIIMATARGERDDIVEALRLGANDYVTKPIDFPVVLARVQTQLDHKRAVDRIVALEADVKRRNAELEQVNARMRRELEMAARLQQSLLPQSPPQVAGVDFAWTYQPCDELAGDIFDVFCIGPDHVGLYLLDVSGHGVRSALLSVTLSRLLSAVGDGPCLVRRSVGSVTEPATPLEVVQELNRRFPMESIGGQYFTILYGVLDLRQRVLRYVNAGHQPPVYLPAGREPQLLEQFGFAVGWMPDGQYEEHELCLEPGDRVLWYSDGIPEAMDAGEQQFGSERLVEVLQRTRSATGGESLQAILAAITEHRGGRPFSDDISALVMNVHV